MGRSALMIVWILLAVSPAWAQVFYMAPYTGSGTEADPFLAAGARQGALCKSLREAETILAGMAVCKGPVLPAVAGVVRITGNDLGRLSAAERASISARTGKPITAETTSALMWELIDANKVPLRRHRDGRQHVVVGGTELASRPAPLSSYLSDALQMLAASFWLPKTIPSSIVSTSIAWAAATLNETWTCADDSTPNYVCDHIWVRYVGSTAEILTNSLRNVNSIGTNLLYNDSVLDSTDMFHQVDVVDIARGGATNVSGGAGARHTGTSTSTYVYCILRDADTDQVEVGHVVTGSLTVDGTVNEAVGGGDTVAVQAVDDQLSCRHNGTMVLGPITEAAGDGNVNVMVRFGGSGTPNGSTQVVLDNSFGTIQMPGSFGAIRRRMQ